MRQYTIEPIRKKEHKNPHVCFVHMHTVYTCIYMRVSVCVYFSLSHSFSARGEERSADEGTITGD